MKKLSIILGLAFAAQLSYSQEMKTLFKKDTTQAVDTYGGYGAPIVGLAMLNNNFGTMVGGKGGLIRNHTFGFGGIGVAIIGNSATEISDTTTSKIMTNDSIFTHNLSMGYGGLFFEYIFNANSPIHISLPLNIVAGGVLGAGDRSNSNIKSSAFFMVEPGINVDFNFSKNFVPGITVSYKIVNANNSITSTAVSGINIALVLKLGKF